MADHVDDSSDEPTSPAWSSDADRWNARYRSALMPELIEPPELIEQLAPTVTSKTRALDLACGFGDAGLFLAQHGAKSTCADVSPVALDLVRSRADGNGLSVETIVVDLANARLPEGPWDLISCVHYLNRPMLASLGAVLARSGRAAIAIATTTNLERHSRPSARFLLEPDELPTLVPGLEILHHDEGWRANGIHEAWLIAQKT